MKKIGKRTVAMLLVVLLLGGAAPLGAVTLRASAKTIVDYARGDLVTFGWYPQTDVTAAMGETLSALAPAWANWTSYGYYSGTDSTDGQMTAKDYMRYCDVLYGGQKYRGVRFTAYRPYWTGYTSSASNTYQDNNGYSTGTTYWFRYEPLQWRVLDPAAGLVLCETILDSQPYNNYILSSGTDAYGYTAYWGDAGKTHYANNYAESSLRQWLNADFYNTAFSAAQQAIIADTTLDNSAYSTSCSAYDSASTTDKVFLLSYDEVMNSNYGFPTGTGGSALRQAQGSDYAKCQGLWVYSSNKCSHWWLRSPGYCSSYACSVIYVGSVSSNCDVSDTYIGIRPALKLNLSSAIFQSDVGEVGAGTCDLRTPLTVSQTSVVSKAAQENEEYRKIYFDGLGLAMDGANYKPNYTIPGLRETDNMIPQGIAFWNAKNALLISAYSADKSRPSTIYALDASNGALVAQYSLRAESGADSFAHTGGIAVSANNLYLSYGNGVAYIPLDDFTDGDGSVTIAGVRSLENELSGANVSYASVTNNTLYCGNFFEASSSSYNTPAGATNSAVLTVALSGASSAAEWTAFCSAVPQRYNIPNEISNIQGATVAGNRLFLNCSFGRGRESILYVSDPLTDQPLAPTLSFADFRAVKGLPMLEDMEYSGGYLYTLTESAAYNYKEGADGNGKSLHPTDAVWRIACRDLLSANEYTTVTFWEDDKQAGICKETGQLDVGFRDNWFSRSASTYNPYLGAFCSDIVLLGYAPTANIRSEMTNLGFTIPANLINKKAGRDEVNYFIATKPMGDDLLVLVATIGSQDDQWYSNFDPNGTERETGTASDRNYHLGFLDAKEYVYKKLEDNISTITSGYEINHVKFLFTGHSRGAAAANLLAAQFVDDAQKSSGMAQTGNIYAYTFATPNVGLKKAINGGQAKYDCIFNIVNPEDFVTKVLPADWGYGRYGVTYVLPSATNTVSKYYKKNYLKNVQEFYAQHTQKNYSPYKVAGIQAGEAVTYGAIKLMTTRVGSVDELYDDKGSVINYGLVSMKVSPYSFFRNTMMAFLANINRFDEPEAQVKILAAVDNILAMWTTLTPTAQSLFYDTLLTYFLSPVVESLISIAKNPATLPLQAYKLWSSGYIYFATAHQAETYCAYMNTMGALTKSDGTNGFLHSVNCPVDVEVYDRETGALVGRIVNNTVDTAVAEQDNAIVMLVDGDSKMFWLPENGDFEVKLIGNDTGTMDYTVAAVDSDTGETERVNFFDVPITDGKVMTGDVTAEDFALEEYTLTTDSGAQITATEIDEEAQESFTITTTVTGDGYAMESLEAVSGDYVTLTATANEGSAFVGWYENGTLVSDSAEYAFVVKANRSLTAKFETVTPTSVRISQMPTKTVYTYRSDTNLDLSGLELEVTYSDGSKKTVADTSSFKVSGYSAKPRGEKTITVEYEGLKTEFKVMVKLVWWQWIIRIFLFGFLWY